MKTMLWCIAGGAALLASLLAPSLLSNFATGIVATAFIFAIFALSLNLILGHAGLPSLGHAVFLGIGAYTVALLIKNGVTHNFVLCTLSGIGASALTALVIGPVLLRTRTVYFLMATLAIGEVFRNVAISWRSVTGGDDGLSGIDPGIVGGIDLGKTHNFYYLTLVSLLVVMALMAMLTSAPFGHALRALRDNRSRMAVLGVNPLSVELTAFVISAGLAGFAGVLLAYEKAFVYPTLFSVETSARVLLMVVLGGAGTLVGPVAGALLVEFIRGIGSVYTDRWQTILGLLAVIVALNSRELLLGGILSLVAHARAKDPTGQRPVFETKADVLAPASPVVVPSAPIALDRATCSTEHVLIKADNIVKRFGGLSVLNGVSLAIGPGERRGLIGPNGAGKTTFLNILSSTLPPTAGRIFYGGKDITALPEFRRARLGIGRTFQVANLFNDCTVHENLMLALVARQKYGLRMTRPLDRYADIQREVAAMLEKWNVRKIANVKVKLLSYGERRVIEIVLALATKPQLLLLDEPAAGLTSAETKRIIETISSLDPTLSIIIVDHNMDLIFSICDQVTVFANGQVLAEGVGDKVRRDKLVMEAYLGMPL